MPQVPSTSQAVGPASSSVRGGGGNDTEDSRDALTTMDQGSAGTSRAWAGGAQGTEGTSSAHPTAPFLRSHTAPREYSREDSKSLVAWGPGDTQQETYIGGFFIVVDVVNVSG